MIDVCVQGNGVDAARFAQEAQRAQDRFRFHVGENGRGVGLRIINQPHCHLFAVESGGHVTVSMWQSVGICRYTGLDGASFLLVCSLLGLTWWRTLSLNPLLVTEDLRHPPARDCLFAQQPCREDYALLLDDPALCPGCLDFFRCLGAELEIHALQAALAHVTSRSRSDALGGAGRSRTG